jgi:murein biosynthesis integral membrane protein MurJ
VVAMIIGSIFRLLIQLPFIDWKWRFKPDFRFKDQEIIPMLKGLPSVAITAAIAHINGMVDKIVASGAVSGSVACLNYGNKLMNVFSGMISTAISTAVYPTMIQCIAEKENEKLRSLLRNTICALMFVIVPISLFCVLFSSEIVTVAFQRGAFDSSATALTAEVFIGYSVGMIFVGIATIVTNVFYGFGDTKITMYISLIEIVLNIIFDLTFVRLWGVAGLAFATSISAAICLLIRFCFLRRYVSIGFKSIFAEALKIIGIAAFSCVVPFVLQRSIFRTGALLTLVSSFVLGAAIYFSLSILMKIKTLAFVRGIIKRRLQ